MNAYMFNKKVKTLLADINDKRVKYGIRNFFGDQEAIPVGGVSEIDVQFHKIETKTERNEIKVTVTIGRPGYFIGAHGKTIDALESYLGRLTGKPVKISVKEFDPFI